MDDSLFHLIFAQIPFLSYADFAYANAQMREQGLTPRRFLSLSPLERRKNIRLPHRIHHYLDSVSQNLSAVRQLHIRLARLNIRLLTAHDDEYPQRLRELPDAARPPFLFLKGNISALSARYQIAIVGTRRATPDGKRLTRAYARALAAQGANIISGGAAGIDTEAHLGALESGGVTTIVLPQGVLTFEPKPPLKGLMNASNTLLISQFPPLQPWAAVCAVQRNAVVAALAQAAIVGETLLRSGTAYVIRQMLRERKPLFAIVYDGESPGARASRSLLSSGAHPLPADSAVSKATVSAILRSIR